MKVTGMAAVAEREGAELVDLGSDDTPNRTVYILMVELSRSCRCRRPCSTRT